jgi:Ca-activated chloride channel family protein
MRFHDPWVLWLWLVVPAWWWWQRRQGQQGGLQFSSVVPAQGARSVWARVGPPVLLGLRGLAVVALIGALARPQLGRSESRVKTEGIDIVLAVDVSGSMQALDFQLDGQPADRLTVVKNVVQDFVRTRGNDRIGMVAFARRAYVASPLTLDHDWLELNLGRIKIGLIEDGTALGAGLGTAVNRLRDSTAQSRVVVLLTDGVNNVHQVPPLEAAAAAKEFGVRVYTIGAGTKGLAPMPVYRGGQLAGYRNVPVEIDEELLREIAKRTGGQYYRATDTESLREIYRQIDQLEKRAIETVKYEEWRELFHWWLWPGLGCLLVAVLLEHTRLRRLP